MCQCSDSPLPEERSTKNYYLPLCDLTAESSAPSLINLCKTVSLFEKVKRLQGFRTSMILQHWSVLGPFPSSQELEALDWKCFLFLLFLRGKTLNRGALMHADGVS